MTSPRTSQFTPPTPRVRWRRLRLGLLLGVAAATMVPVAEHAQAQTDSGSDGGGYVTTTLPGPSLDVSGFSPECIRDAPHIRYVIVPRGFTPPSTQATLTIKDRNGNVLDTVVVDSFTGSIIWPGATVDANGNATDWPGWKRADDGESWIPDPSDSFVREGLVIEVSVNATATTTVSATATVSYPPTTSPCANPPGGTPPTTTVCVPGQNNDANPADDCDLATTGGGPGNAVMIGAAALLAGLLFLTAARRRRGHGDIPTPT
jgi:hypothetical protein